MNKAFLVIIPITILAACSSPTPDQEIAGIQSEDCRNNPRATQYELNMCAGQMATQTSQQLAQLLEEIEEDLPNEFWIQLEENQVLWEKLREQDCQLNRSFFEGGSMAPMMYGSCINQQNLARIKFLKLSMCTAGGRWNSESYCEDLESNK
jgi:uncharacterized protein YecT (DUF1311 family)